MSETRLILGDCLDVLRTLESGSVDAVITDPPYCSGASLEAQKNQKAQGLRSATVQGDGFAWFAADNMGTAGLVWLLREVAIEARRILTQNRSMLVFCDWRMVPHLAPAIESSGLRWRNMVVWQKPNAALGNGFRSSHELVLEFTNGVTEYQRKDGTNCISAKRVPSSARNHMAQKPVELLSELLTMVAPPGGTVLDPFMGSGTTGVACVETGRDFIGIEISPEYHAIAEARIAEAKRKLQPALALTEES